jgi:hypothetical protein
MGGGGVAVLSLALGVFSLLFVMVPFFPLLPGSLAVLLGVVAVGRIRQQQGKGANLAIAGIVCAFIAMAPTALLVPALLGWGGKAIQQVQKEIQKPQPLLDEASRDGRSATLTIQRQSPRGYSVQQTAVEPGAVQSTSVNSTGGRTEAVFASDAPDVKYKGRLTEVAGGRVELTIDLENKTPFRWKIEGLHDAAATDNGKSISLADPLPPGKHSLKITGKAR